MFSALEIDDGVKIDEKIITLCWENSLCLPMLF